MQQRLGKCRQLRHPAADRTPLHRPARRQLVAQFGRPQIAGGLHVAQQGVTVRGPPHHLRGAVLVDHRPPVVVEQRHLHRVDDQVVGVEMGLVGPRRVVHKRRHPEPRRRPVAALHHPVAGVLLQVRQGGVHRRVERLGDVGADGLVTDRPQQRDTLRCRAHQVESHHRFGHQPVGHEAFHLPPRHLPLPARRVLAGQQIRLRWRRQGTSGHELDQPPRKALVDLIKGGRGGEKRLRLVLCQTPEVPRVHPDQERRLSQAEQLVGVAATSHGPRPLRRSAASRSPRCPQQHLPGLGVAAHQNRLQLRCRHRPDQPHRGRSTTTGPPLRLTLLARHVVADHSVTECPAAVTSTPITGSITGRERTLCVRRRGVALAALQVRNDAPSRHPQRPPGGRPHP